MRRCSRIERRRGLHLTRNVVRGLVQSLQKSQVTTTTWSRISYNTSSFFQLDWLLGRVAWILPLSGIGRSEGWKIVAQLQSSRAGSSSTSIMTSQIEPSGQIHPNTTGLFGTRF